MPVLGVIGMARRSAVAPDDEGDVALLESIALSVAPVVENARLFEELRKSQRFGEHVRDSMTSALVAVNMKGDVLSFNRAAEELLGFSEAETLGQPFGALFGPDGEALVRAAVEHGRVVRREETVLRGTRAGSVVALGSTGGVITSAGLVLAATFLVLGTIPLVFLAELGVTVALGILLDTMIVRSVLVTAINLDLGQRIWWPSALAKRDEDELGSPPEQPDTDAQTWERTPVG